MAIRRFVVTGQHSSPADFKDYLYTSLQQRTHLRITATEDTSENDLAKKRGIGTTEESFEAVIRELHPADDNFFVTVTNVETGDWLLINVMDDKVCFELVD